MEGKQNCFIFGAAHDFIFAVTAEELGWWSAGRHCSVCDFSMRGRGGVATQDNFGAFWRWNHQHDCATAFINISVAGLMRRRDSAALCLLRGIVAVRDFDVRGSVAEYHEAGGVVAGAVPCGLDLSAISSRH